MEVDFAAQLRRNLASRRSVQLRRAARPAAAPTPMVPLLAGVTAVPTASREGSVPSGKAWEGERGVMEMARAWKRV